MPYNTSKKVVQRMRGYLDQLAANKRTLTWPASDPQNLAYRIREALKAAKRYQEFRHYHDLTDFYQICVLSGRVQAKWMGMGTAAVIEEAPEAMSIPEVLNVHGVVGACIKFDSKTDEIQFPNAILKQTELKALYQWGKASDNPWKLIYQGEAGVTMTRRKVDSMFLWSPTVGDEDEGS